MWIALVGHTIAPTNKYVDMKPKLHHMLTTNIGCLIFSNYMLYKIVCL